MRAHHWIATGPNGPADFRFVETGVREPGHGEVTITVQAAGVNPADLKHAARATSFPVPIGYEVAGTITALGEGTDIASGGGAIGDAVLAFRVQGGWSSIITVPADRVFARPASLTAIEAANLLLVGTTAAELLRVAAVEHGETVVVFGASGAVGTALLQIARARGIRVIGVCGEGRGNVITRFGGVAVERTSSAADLAQRIALAAGDPVAAVFDASGRDDDIATAVLSAGDRSRMVTIVGSDAARTAGFRTIAGSMPESAAYRDSVRADIIAMAAAGDVMVPVSETFVLRDAREAIALVACGRAGGKVALVPDSNDV
ncbi:zinc-binding dehydrogenase [Microbacterium sp. NC79]|uniref:quinone oxidoreductase family protein n=1 Tax=Microbacterium sp. NC79 TaxID=2851009 RepID=UPI001C2C9DED|nr:zinc-binding dehydrogenase [Microbacterium sp. NC79]MBV0893751.1 zinc-binding dehydrogenase [Microbacterium sp. NC79]